MNLPRKFHEVYAKTNGYFWLPCTLCGEMYGGHEKGQGSLYYIDDPNCGTSVCPNCAVEAAYINARHFPHDAARISVGASYEKRTRFYELLENGLTREERERQRAGS